MVAAAYICPKINFRGHFFWTFQKGLGLGSRKLPATLLKKDSAPAAPKVPSDPDSGVGKSWNWVEITFTYPGVLLDSREKMKIQEIVFEYFRGISKSEFEILESVKWIRKRIRLRIHLYRKTLYVDFSGASRGVGEGVKNKYFQWKSLEFLEIITTENVFLKLDQNHFCKVGERSPRPNYKKGSAPAAPKTPSDPDFGVGKS